jgi:hypothetical protein
MDIRTSLKSVVGATASSDHTAQLTTLAMGRSRQFGVNILATVHHEEYLMASGAT